MRILIANCYFAPAWGYGGPARLLYELAGRLSACGHQVTVITSDASDGAGRYAGADSLEDNVRVVRCKTVSQYLAFQCKQFIAPAYPGVQDGQPVSGIPVQAVYRPCVSWRDAAPHRQSGYRPPLGEPGLFHYVRRRARQAMRAALCFGGVRNVASHRTWLEGHGQAVFRPIDHEAHSPACCGMPCSDAS